MADVEMDNTSDGGCGNRRQRRRWLPSAYADSDGDGGDGMNNREGGRAGEDRGMSSVIFDYSVEPDSNIL